MNCKLSKLSLALALASGTLAACGGGGGSGDSAGANPASVTTLDVSGVAATGAALASANISVKCAVGSANTTSAADGKFSVSMSNGTLPCVVRAVSADSSTTLHSAIEGSGNGQVTVNVTPMTELIVAQTQGGSPAALFDQFDANKVKLTQANLDAAKAIIRAVLSSIVDITGIDPIKDALVAATAAGAGNTYDQKLDRLRDALAAAQITLGELTALQANNLSGSVAEVVRVALQPANTGCKGFRSGTFRVIEPAGTTRVSEVSFDAQTLTAVTPSGNMQLTAQGCTLSLPDGGTIQFAFSGLGVMRTGSGNMAILMPKQNLQLSDLAGTLAWVDRFQTSNGAGATTYKVGWGTTQFDANGKAQSGADCQVRAAGEASCVASTTEQLPQMQLSTDGAFVVADDTSGERYYGFRSPAGVVGIVGVSTSSIGKLMIGRVGTGGVLPAVDDVYRRFDLGIGSTSIVDPAFNAAEYTVTQVSPSTSSFTRRRTSDCRIDSLTLNNPYPGLFERPAGSSANCSAATVSYEQLIGSYNAGLGISAWVIPSTNFMGTTISSD